MITRSHIDNMLGSIGEIHALVKKYHLADIALAEPRFLNKENKLHFFIVGKDNQAVPASRCTDVYMDLMKLLKMDVLDENLSVSSLDSFRPGYVQEAYGEQFSFNDSTTKAQLTAFLEEKLGFSTSATSTALPSSRAKRKNIEAVPDHDTLPTDNNSDVNVPAEQKNEGEHAFFAEQPAHKKSKVVAQEASGTSSSQQVGLFVHLKSQSRKIRHDISLLPLDIQKALEVMLEKLKYHPQHTLTVTHCIIESMGQQSQLVSGKG